METEVEGSRSLLNFFVQTSSWNIGRLEEIIKTGVNLNKPVQNYNRTLCPCSWSFVPDDDSAPLHIAAVRGDNNVVQMLLDHGAEVDIRDREQNTPLHAAAEEGNHETVQLLLSKRATVSARNRSGNTPLHVTKSKKVAEVLLRNGASVLEKNDHNQTALRFFHKPPFQSCRCGGWREIMVVEDEAEVSDEDGAEVNDEDEHDRSPMNFNFCKHLIATHTHLSGLAGLPVCEDLKMSFPLSEEEREKAVQELERIKATKISEQVCLHDIFVKFQHPRYLLNEGVIEDIELFFQSPEFQHRFPMYADVLTGTFIQSKKSRYYLTKIAAISMMSDTRIEYCQLCPDLVWEHVFEFLDLDDLTNIIQSEV